MRNKTYLKQNRFKTLSHWFAPIANNSGQSMVEMLVIFTVMFTLIFGAIQFALIYHAKITLNYAVYEATRAGTLNNALFSAVKEGFARGLAPLYSYSADDSDQVGAFQDARTKVLDEFDDTRNLIRIERLSPSIKMFSSFSDSDGKIPNDNLRFRSSTVDQAAGGALQDANLLHLRVTYWYPLYVPVINKVIFKFVCGTQDSSSTYNEVGITLESWESAPIESNSTKWMSDKACENEDDPRIPLTAVSVMRMQSDAINSTEFYSP